MCITWKQNEKSAKYPSFSEKMKDIFKDFTGEKVESKSYKIADLDNAVNLLYLNKDKPIRIIGDYDTDGMSSIIELMLLMSDLKISDVHWYIPDRELDGYGASVSIVEHICNGLTLHDITAPINNGTGLLITVDNGIAAIDAIQRAKDLGWQILILDHHLPPKDTNGNIILPNADVIIDPHAVDCGADFIDYCGAGLVYKFAQHIKCSNINNWTISDETMAKINGMAAIATIGDNVSFVLENTDGSYLYDNYLIVKNGLFQLTQNAGRTTGMYCLFVGANQKYETAITVQDIGFCISPIMNAASRMETFGSTKVVDLFLQNDNDFVTAIAKAKELIEINNLRKKYTDELLPILEKRIEDNHMEDDYPIILTGNEGEIHPGVVGLVAGRIQEKYHTAVIIFAPLSDEKTLRGSARAQKGTNMKDLLDENKELMIAYGGHELAAGISLDASKLEEFTKAIQKTAGDKPEELFYKYYDFVITPDMVENELAIKHQYEPLGFGLPEPVYKISFECDLQKGIYFQILGESKTTLKLLNKHANAINFKNIIPKFTEMGEPTILTLYGSLGENIWNGNVYPQIMFTDMDA